MEDLSNVAPFIVSIGLKTGNIFIDSEGNVRLGDFGLATRHKDGKQKPEIKVEDAESSQVGVIYDAIDDISKLLGVGSSSGHHGASQISHSTAGGESMTGGVGTTFYRAPEQEGYSVSGKKGDNSYNLQADIYSLGIIIFEMFHPPFETVSFYRWSSF